MRAAAVLVGATLAMAGAQPAARAEVEGKGGAAGEGGTAGDGGHGGEPEPIIAVPEYGAPGPPGCSFSR